MATEAQLAANRRNAQHSTGPRTPEGKARAAANAITFGLFTTANLVEPGDEAEYAAFTEAFRAQLAPEGAIEDTLAIEVIAAAWRLRRCGIIESNLLHCDDPDATQTAVDRARNQAHRLYVKGLAELRRLQTERQLRFEILPSSEDSALVSFRDIVRDLKTHAAFELAKQRLRSNETIANLIEDPLPPETPASQPSDPNRVRSVNSPAVARNAPCPCNSGQKYKRCCGRNAPPVLGQAA